MKIIIAGEITEGLEEIMELSSFNVSAVISGGARGVDRLGELWAQYSGVPVVRFIPAWDKFGRTAGLYRNAEMADYADGAVILGESSGTLDMIDKMRRAGKPLEIWIWDGEGFEYLGG